MIHGNRNIIPCDYIFKISEKTKKKKTNQTKLQRRMGKRNFFPRIKFKFSPEKVMHTQAYIVQIQYNRHMDTVRADRLYKIVILLVLLVVLLVLQTIFEARPMMIKNLG